MSEWKKTTLGEIADIEMGQSPKGETCNTIGNGIPLLNGPTEFKIKNPKAVQYTIDSKRECRPLDLLFCVRGSTGRMNWADKRYSIGRGLAAIRHKSGSEYRCFLRGIIDYNLKVLLSSATGSIFSNITKKQLENLEIKLPPLSEQKSIASVLSSLDDKIDLLHRQNATLEKMAETLFRQWFVEEEKEEWEEGDLGEVIEIYDNLRIPLSKMERDKKKDGQLYPYYGAAEIMDYINDYIFDGEYILLGEDGTVRTNEGYPVLQYATGKFWVNNHAHVIQAIPPYNNFFIWIYLKKKNIDEIVTGAVQPKINQANLKSIDFPKYPKRLVIEFIDMTEPLFQKLKSNTTQIRTLTALRDTLLPKLMSGEVRVEMENTII
ncbi:MAG TPA: restriction endonuclease subunit S [Bacteroidales bacterium]|jgi:type I restriction enzyme S subunit|nr:restriction endonuclease subunit S [Bacteroidales bacterium]